MATATATLQSKFDATEASMQNFLFERRDHIEVLLTALISDTNPFFLGLPGTAKTYMIKKLQQHISDVELGDFYSKLMTRYTTPSEVFGALDVAAMDQGIHRHVIDYRSIVVARFGFLDEIWKIGSSMANAFLSITNERVFFNDVPIEMPKLLSIGGASNEMPQGEGLEAIFDRFGFRMVVEPLRSPSSVRKMIDAKLDHGHITIEPTISFQDFYTAADQVRATKVSVDVRDALVQLQVDFRGEGVDISERKIDNFLRIIQATAWRRGAEEADIPDMRLLIHSAWDTPDNKPIADKLVLGLAAPFDAEAMKLRENVDKLADEVAKVIASADNDVQRTQTAVSIHGKVQRAQAEAKALRDRADRPSAAIDNVLHEVKELKRRVLRDLLLVDPDSVTRDEE